MNPELHKEAKSTISEARSLIKIWPDLSPEDRLKFAVSMTDRLLTIMLELHLTNEAIKAEIERIVPPDLLSFEP
jgi:hypothetical protein